VIRDELFDTGLATRRRMFGPPGAEQQTDDPGPFTEKLQEIVTRWCFGDVWARPELGHRDRSLITLAMLVALGRPHEIRIHVRGAVANGVTVEEIRELLVHAVVYCGLPAAVDGFRQAEAVLDEVAAENAR
jgi:4-carboxymuconolactone decarboxylase